MLWLRGGGAGRRGPPTPSHKCSSRQLVPGSGNDLFGEMKVNKQLAARDKYHSCTVYYSCILHTLVLYLDLATVRADL
eukprot:COSAG05_NODE_2859_length_2562_cov_279.182704_3_plen_77_part_01